MEEIKVNDFVRTKQGYIAKCVEVDEYGDYYTFDEFVQEKYGDKYSSLYERGLEDIVKHSSNIKDLVQAGDIIIYTINCKIADIDIVKEHTDARTLEKSLRVGLYSLEQVDIKQILTKEKFESESYRLEE